MPDELDGKMLWLWCKHTIKYTSTILLYQSHWYFPPAVIASLHDSCKRVRRKVSQTALKCSRQWLRATKSITENITFCYWVYFWLLESTTYRQVKTAPVHTVRVFVCVFDSWETKTFYLVLWFVAIAVMCLCVCQSCSRPSRNLTMMRMASSITKT